MNNYMENDSNITDYYKKTATFWSDMMGMMSSKSATLSAVGPLRNLSTNLKKITNELTEANKETVEFNNDLGKVRFSMSLREKIIVMSFPIESDILMITMEKNARFENISLKILKSVEKL